MSMSTRQSNLASLDVGDDTHTDDSCFGSFFEVIRRRLTRAKKKKLAKDLLSISNTIRAGGEGRPDNVVVTTKYTWYNFIPLAVSLQFRRAANLFYLIVIIMISIGYFAPSVFQAPYQPYGTLFVLFVVISVTISFEAVDDVARYRADVKTNNKLARKISPSGEIQETTWGKIHPGDVIRVMKGELIPCDLLVIETDSPNGVCYIETSGIDGETNLKIRTAPLSFREQNITAKTISGVLTYEEPNAYLQFSGRLENPGKHENISVGMDAMILRGSQLRNTHWIDGVAIYTGPETKLVMSSGNTPSKFARVDIVVNRIIGYSSLTLVILAVISMILVLTWVPNTLYMWYFRGIDVVGSYVFPGWLAYLCTFVGLYANMIPINIYLCLEITNFVHSYFYCNDQHMYDPKTDTPAVCRTAQLVAEIGQVTHIFSDKTGTLTNNEMRLVSLVVGPVLYGFEPEKTTQTRHSVGATGEIDVEVVGMAQPPKIPTRQLFPNLIAEQGRNTKIATMLRILALCHTVVIDRAENGDIQYNAEGPDEEALVVAVAALGARLMSTENNRYHVEFDYGDVKSVTYEVLGVNRFTSDRKRMSIVLRDVDSGHAYLFMKGADNVMFELCKPLDPEDPNTNTVNDLLSRLSSVGLRTLVVAQKQLSEQETTDYKNGLFQAGNEIGEARSNALSALAGRIETNMEYVGMTAIEDALQDQVPETIRKIRDAGISLWVATGDKIQTAINIAFSAQIIDSDMHQIVVSEGTTDELLRTIERTLELLNRIANTVDHTVFEDEDEITGMVGKNLALVVSGSALNQLLSHEKGTRASEHMLLDLANRCSVVLACRVSPQQKALLVRMVVEGSNTKKRKAPVTLAIGDGANDVPMIQEAKVGVGISGHEGLQAVNSSDFAIARFKFLQETLFVHGRWNYFRISILLRYILIVWASYTWLLFTYGFYSMFSGEQIYFNWSYSTVYAWTANAYITGLSWLQQDISREYALNNPECYYVGRLNLYLNTRALLIEVGRSIAAAGLVLLFTFYTAGLGYTASLFGATLYASLWTVMLVRQVELGISWSWLNFLFLFLVCLLYILMFYVSDMVIGGLSNTYVVTPPFVQNIYGTSLGAAFSWMVLNIMVFGIPKLLKPSQMNRMRLQDRYPNRFKISRQYFAPIEVGQVSPSSDYLEKVKQRSDSESKVKTLIAEASGRRGSSLRPLRGQSTYVDIAPDDQY